MKDIIGIMIGTPNELGHDDPEGEVVTEWHIFNLGDVSDYDTLCGIDADDPSIGHFGTVAHEKGIKVTCSTCQAIWDGVKHSNIRTTDFRTK